MNTIVISTINHRIQPLISQLNAILGGPNEQMGCGLKSQFSQTLKGGWFRIPDTWQSDSPSNGLAAATERKIHKWLAGKSQTLENMENHRKFVGKILGKSEENRGK